MVQDSRRYKWVCRPAFSPLPCTPVIPLGQPGFCVSHRDVLWFYTIQGWASCSPWSRKESGTTGRLNNNPREHARVLHPPFSYKRWHSPHMLLYQDFISLHSWPLRVASDSYPIIQAAPHCVGEPLLTIRAPEGTETPRSTAHTAALMELASFPPPSSFPSLPASPPLLSLSLTPLPAPQPLLSIFRFWGLQDCRPTPWTVLCASAASWVALS